MVQNSLFGPDVFGTIVLTIILGGCLAIWYANSDFVIFKKHEKKLDFEIWRVLMEGFGYLLLATSFVSRLFFTFYEIVIIEISAIIFCMYKVATVKNK